jgi:hypothetical protein
MCFGQFEKVLEAIYRGLFKVEKVKCFSAGRPSILTTMSACSTKAYAANSKDQRKTLRLISFNALTSFASQILLVAVV